MFETKDLKRLLLASVASLALSACGGGSSAPQGSNNPPPGSNTPPPGTNNPPPKLSLTLTGTVTDAPVANANVTATVGGQTFSTAADANGNYSLEIEIDEADADEFVALRAQGVNEQSSVVFTSLAGSFASLAEQAGDDDVLSSSENFATQITNVSTAAAVLMQEANGGEPITSDAQLQSVSASVDGQAVLDLAAAIKLSVDSAADYPLPEGQSILDVISDEATRAQFVAENRAQDPQAFAAAQTAIAADPTLTQAVTVADVPETLIAASLSTEPGFSFNLYNRVSNFTFAADGTGTAAGGTYTRPITWSVEGSSVKVLFEEPVRVVRVNVSGVCQGVQAAVETHVLSEGVTLTLLSERTLAMTETGEIAYSSCAALMGQTVTTTTARTILDTEDFLEIPAEDFAADNTMTLSVYDESQGFVTGELAEFHPDGTGITKMRGTTFTWSIEDGRIMNVTFANGSTGRYAALREVDDYVDDVVWGITTPMGPFSDAGALVSAADSDDPVAFTAADVPGRYYDLGYGNEAAPHPLLGGFRYRFDADGAGSNENDFVDGSGAVVVQSRSTNPAMGYYWGIENGDVVIIRSQNGCLPGTEGCVSRLDRKIRPLAIGTGVDGRKRVYALDKLMFTPSGNSAPSTFYIPRFYDYDPPAGG